MGGPRSPALASHGCHEGIMQHRAAPCLGFPKLMSQLTIAITGVRGEPAAIGDRHAPQTKETEVEPRRPTNPQTKTPPACARGVSFALHDPAPQRAGARSSRS